MTAAEIHKKLSERFGEATVAWHEPQAGDPCVIVRPEALRDVCLVLQNDSALAFDFLRLITGVDWSDRISAVYHLYSYTHNHQLTLRVDVARDNPRVASVTDIWPTAEWLEREAWDMMGIVFEGHKDLRRILLPLDWQGHPLRKDYEPPKEYHGIKHD